MNRIRNLIFLSGWISLLILMQGCSLLPAPYPEQDEPTGAARSGWESSGRIPIRSSFSRD